ncbi:MAG: RagB/SusD family nutrient uptake outer membrane protein [Odoribacter sp.]|nr:RagB/SusD family nutrient uptake outer membrane protein [Odoribacter sp.]
MGIKKYIYIILLVTAVLLNGCNNWLDIAPENAQVTDEYWKAKEEVEAVLAAGYVELRSAVETYLIPWGELRASSISNYTSTSELQTFQVRPSSSIAKWEQMYKVINMANSVLDNVETVLKYDETFEESMLNSYKCEAYFLRALSYFYLVRNFKEVPLVLTAYVDDQISYEIAKSPEEEIIAQIKADLTTALNTGAAKTYYENTWETKGRATKWALHALMADVCLWSEDYATAIIHCNEIIEATDAFRPVLLDGKTEDAQWFVNFYSGNSNESIFEIQWSYSNEQTNNLSTRLFGNSSPTYVYSQRMLQDFIAEINSVGDIYSAVRVMYGGVITDNPTSYEQSTLGYVWKYTGNGIQSESGVRASSEYDSHFIVYRMADVLLMKAEALIMNSNSEESWTTAVELINQIRNRAGLPNLLWAYEEVDESDMLEYVLNERNIEFAGEGKRWYDLLRMGKRNNYAYRDRFIVSIAVEYNQSTNSSWVRSVLRDNNAHYLPIHADEIQNNKLLEQNPYYGS